MAFCSYSSCGENNIIIFESFLWFMRDIPMFVDLLSIYREIRFLFYFFTTFKRIGFLWLISEKRWFCLLVLYTVTYVMSLMSIVRFTYNITFFYTLHVTLMLGLIANFAIQSQYLWSRFKTPLPLFWVYEDMKAKLAVFTRHFKN